MIKFYRQIRKALLSNGKTGKYIKYAIGEIILVVIGILIALAINNWNQNRIAEDRAYGLMVQIKEDLQADLDYFNVVGGALTQRVLLFEDYINSEFQSDSLSREAANSLSGSASPREFGRSYKNLLNSNGLVMINEIELLDKIEYYYLTECYRYNDHAEYHKTFNIQNIDGHLTHSLKKNRQGNYTLESLRKEIDSGSFFSLLYWQFGYMKKMNVIIEECTESAKEIMARIEELEKRKG